jgi:ketosteroid isomerase-like protein
MTDVSAQTRIQVMDVIDQMARYYSRRDVERVLSLVDESFCGFGTGPDEKVVGRKNFRDQLERDFGQCDSLSMELSDVRLFAEGTIAWFMAECTITATISGKSRKITGRMTGVLRGTGHTWVFAQTHFSVPDRDQEPGKSYPSR